MKKYDVYLMPDAIKDLENIYGYISDKSGFPERAWAYIEKLRQKCHELETAPLRGQQRDERGARWVDRFVGRPETICEQRLVSFSTRSR